MKRTKILGVFLLAFILLSSALVLASCGGDKEVKLTAPTVTLDGDTARWEADALADKFEISISGNLSYIENSVTSRKLEDGQSFKLRTIGDGKKYTNSDWSNLVTYTAPEAPDEKYYTVTWKNGDTVIEVDENVPLGEMPTYSGVTPTKAPDAQYTYTFTGWTPELAPVSGDVTYTATFATEINTYTVVWKNGDTVLETDSGVPYGTVPTYDGATPEKAADNAHEYVFIGWSPEVSPVTQNSIYVAEFASTENKHVVTFYDDDGVSVLGVSLVSNGETALFKGSVPTKNSTERYVYTFAGWASSLGSVVDADLSNITGDLKVYARYAESIRMYKVTFCDWNGTVLHETNVAYGDTAVAPVAPKRENHTFIGWDKDFDTITSDTVINACYEEIVLHSITYENLKGADYPEITTYREDEGVARLPKISVPGYNFLGWYTAATEDKPSTLVERILPNDTRDYELTARWELVTYSITYIDAPVHDNFTSYTIETETFTLKNAIWSGLSFAYWTDESGNIVTKIDRGSIGNIELTANWISEENKAVSSTDKTLAKVLYDEETERYYFIYELGIIDNVVLKTVEVQDKMLGESL